MKKIIHSFPYKYKVNHKKKSIDICVIFFAFEVFSRIIISSFIWVASGGVIFSALLFTEIIYLFLIIFHYKYIVIQQNTHYTQNQSIKQYICIRKNEKCWIQNAWDGVYTYQCDKLFNMSRNFEYNYGTWDYHTLLTYETSWLVLSKVPEKMENERTWESLLSHLQLKKWQ